MDYIYNKIVEQGQNISFRMGGMYMSNKILNFQENHLRLTLVHFQKM